MGILVTVTAPVIQPVTLDEAKNQCRIFDDTSHDSLLVRLIAAATAEVESYTGVSLTTRTLRLDMDGFQTQDIYLQTYPVQSITSVKYDDGSGVEQTVSTVDYYKNLNGMQPMLRSVSYWPATLIDKLASARITFVAGYTDISLIPEDIRHAILLRVFEMWEPAENEIAKKMATSARVW